MEKIASFAVFGISMILLIISVQARPYYEDQFRRFYRRVSDPIRQPANSGRLQEVIPINHPGCIEEMIEHGLGHCKDVPDSKTTVFLVSPPTSPSFDKWLLSKKDETKETCMKRCISDPDCTFATYTPKGVPQSTLQRGRSYCSTYNTKTCNLQNIRYKSGRTYKGSSSRSRFEVLEQTTFFKKDCLWDETESYLQEPLRRHQLMKIVNELDVQHCRKNEGLAEKDPDCRKIIGYMQSLGEKCSNGRELVQNAECNEIERGLKKMYIDYRLRMHQPECGSNLLTPQEGESDACRQYRVEFENEFMLNKLQGNGPFEYNPDRFYQPKSDFPDRSYRQRINFRDMW